MDNKEAEDTWLKQHLVGSNSDVQKCTNKVPWEVRRVMRNHLWSPEALEQAARYEQAQQDCKVAKVNAQPSRDDKCSEPEQSVKDTRGHPGL